MLPHREREPGAGSSTYVKCTKAQCFCALPLQPLPHAGEETNVPGVSLTLNLLQPTGMHSGRDTGAHTALPAAEVREATSLYSKVTVGYLK